MLKENLDDTLFLPGKVPKLVYITNQVGGKNWIDRPMHTHDHVAEVNLVIEGSALYNIDGDSYPVKSGDIVFSNPQVPHEVVADTDALPNTFCFGITDFQRPGLPENCLIPEDVSPIHTFPELFPCLREICFYLYNAITPPVDSSAFSLLFHTFLGIVLRSEPANSIVQADPDSESIIAHRAKSYIDQHFVEALTLEEIASALNCSAPYLSHAFKSSLGYSPIQYQTRCRIGLAQNYLIDTDYSATRIATLVGYNNTNYFTSVFTKIVGATPIQYRKQYLKDINKNAT